MTQEDLNNRQLPPYAHEEAKKDIRKWYRPKHGQTMVDMGGITSMNEDEEMTSDEGDDMDVNAPKSLNPQPIEVTSTVPVTVTAALPGSGV